MKYLLLLLGLVLSLSSSAQVVSKQQPDATRPNELIVQMREQIQASPSKQAIPGNLTVQKGSEETDANKKDPLGGNLIIFTAFVTALASILSIIISAWVTLKTKSEEYKNDYYKKVIDNRLIAYNTAYELIASITDITEEQVDSKPYFTLFRITLSEQIKFIARNSMNSGTDIKHLDEPEEGFGFRLFMDKITFVLGRQNWLSQEMIDCIVKIRRIFNDILLESIKEGRIDKDKLIQSGKYSHAKLVSVVKEINEILHADMQNIHEVKAFLNKKLDLKFSNSTNKLYDDQAFKRPLDYSNLYNRSSYN